MEKTYSKSEMITIFNIHKTVLNRIINYLNLQSVDKKYNQDSFDKIKEFLINTPNTRTFFQKQTFLKKYGVENPQQFKIIQNKTKKTILDTYGVDNVSKSKEIKQKKEQTLKSHYGVNNPMKSNIIKEKIVSNWKNKSTDELKTINDNYKKSMIKKYGVDNPLKLNSIKEKSILNRKLNKNKERIEFEKANEKLWSIEELCLNFSKCKDRMYDVIKLFDIEIITLKDNVYIKNSDIHFLQDYFNKSESQSISNEEKELLKFVKSIYSDEIIENDKSVINPYELDIYLPKRNLAFEFNGLYWHSSLHKDKYYHYNKTKKCEEKGIRLIHVFEDDWLYKTDIVKSMIKSSLGIYDDKIFARKCEIKEIDAKSYKKFMNENHLQGFTSATHYVGLFYNNILVQSVGINYNGLNKTIECEKLGIRLIHIWDYEWNDKKEICKSIIASSLGIYKEKYMARKCNIKIMNREELHKMLNENHIQGYAKNITNGLGLYYNDECVQCMAFTDKGHDKNKIELVRMATKNNCQVVGGFSKLLTNSCKIWNYSEIASYISRRLFNGKGYYDINFKQVKINPPQVYFLVNNKIESRHYGMKKNFKKRAEEDKGVYDENKSEIELSYINNLIRFYDCGTIKVQLTFPLL